MNRASTLCQEVRALFYGYRAGDCTPLQRRLVEDHLQGCPPCQGEMRLFEALNQNARLGPPPLSDQRKKVILQGIKQRLATQEKTPRLPWSRWLWIPAGGLAAAASLLLFVFAGAGSQASLHSAGWLSNTRQIKAFLPEDSLVALTEGEGDEGPLIELESKALLAHYERLPGQPPLRIKTPHLDAIIRGTVFFVEVEDNKSTVGVQSGTVEVIDADGHTTRLVGPGEEASAGPKKLELEAATSPRFQALLSLFPARPKAETTMALEKRPKRRRRPSPRAELPAEDPGQQAPPLPEEDASPDPGMLSRVVGRRLPALSACYEHGLKNEAQLSGRVELELQYDLEGRVQGVALIRDELARPEVTDCLQREIYRLRFPPPLKAPVTLSLPLAFAPRGVRVGE